MVSLFQTPNHWTYGFDTPLVDKASLRNNTKPTHNKLTDNEKSIIPLQTNHSYNKKEQSYIYKENPNHIIKNPYNFIQTECRNVNHAKI